jgi:hypothetical protein
MDAKRQTPDISRHNGSSIQKLQLRGQRLRLFRSGFPDDLGNVVPSLPAEFLGFDVRGVSGIGKFDRRIRIRAAAKIRLLRSASHADEITRPIDDAASRRFFTDRDLNVAK